MATSNLTVFTDLHLLFLDNYIIDRNVKFTSQRTGIPVATCNKYLLDPAVQEELTKRFKEVAEQCNLTLAEVLNELKRVAFYDVKEHIENINIDPEAGALGVTLKDFKEMDGRAIAEISEKIDPTTGLSMIKIKTHNKLEALKVLTDYFKAGNIINNVQYNINVETLNAKSPQELANDYQSMLNA